MVDEKQVRSRVAGREIAKQILAYAREEILALDIDFQEEDVEEAFFEELRKAAAEKLPKEKPVVAVMGEKEAVKFLSSSIPFGRHAGKSIQEVINTELSYLTWLADEPFMKDLQRFMRRPEIQVRILGS